MSNTPLGCCSNAQLESVIGIYGGEASAEAAATVATAQPDHPHQTCETDAERTALFTRDAIPLLERLFGRALQLTRNYSDAEDLLQETTLKAYTAFLSYQPGTNLAAWLTRIMTNAMIDTHRRDLRRPKERLVHEFLDWHLAPDDRHPTNGRSAEAEVLDHLLESHTLAALQSLNDSDRTVLCYADVDGYRYSEIADALGIPIGTVASRLHNARRKLRMQLADTAEKAQDTISMTPDRKD